MSNEYPDSNRNGVPDAFENRKPISLILQGDEQEQGQVPALKSVHHEGPPTVTLEIEAAKRPAKVGEMYLNSDGTVRIQGYNSGLSEIIVKQIISAPPYWKPVSNRT